ncbi:MAG: winged helix-turn-helix transcriptional regulator [Myxococcales bacterium]|nr:winged helix-turn-helix transcriptional regulator [Myxococcales bacterium]
METPLAEQLARALREIYRHVDVFHDEMLQVTPKELGLLLVVEEHGPTRVKELAQQVNLPLSTVSWTADKMVGRKLLARKTDPHDRRAILLTLTRTGRAAIKAHYSIFDLVAKTALGVLTPEDGQIVMHAIQKVVNQLS